MSTIPAVQTRLVKFDNQWYLCYTPPDLKYKDYLRAMANLRTTHKASTQLHISLYSAINLTPIFVYAGNHQFLVLTIENFQPSATEPFFNFDKQ